jgi:glycosyltransferase involved in cell wall biosynthesis
VVHNQYRTTQPSGENRVVTEEMDLLGAAGHEVSLYERRSDDIETFSLPQKARLPLRVTWSPHDRKAIIQAIQTAKPDLVHVHNTFPLISPSVLGAASGMRIPVVATLHNFRLVCAAGTLFRDGAPCERCLVAGPLPAVRYGCYRESRMATVPLALNIGVHRTLRTWARNVSAFIVLSRLAREKFIAGGLPPHALHVKPNFVKDPMIKRNGEGQFFLYIGRLAAEKGVQDLIKAWAPELGELLIVGDGPERGSVESMAAGDSSIRFLGLQPHDVCLELLRQARALVVPSRWYEGFPMVVAEALATGVPIIAPRSGAFPEIVSHLDTGWLYAPTDVGDLRVGMRALLETEVNTRLGLRARNLYENQYSPEVNIRILESIYEHALSRVTA